LYFSRCTFPPYHGMHCSWPYTTLSCAQWITSMTVDFRLQLSSLSHCCWCSRVSCLAFSLPLCAPHSCVPFAPIRRESNSWRKKVVSGRNDRVGQIYARCLAVRSRIFGSHLSMPQYLRMTLDHQRSVCTRHYSHSKFFCHASGASVFVKEVHVVCCTCALCCCQCALCLWWPALNWLQRGMCKSFRLSVPIPPQSVYFRRVYVSLNSIPLGVYVLLLRLEVSHCVHYSDGAFALFSQFLSVFFMNYSWNICVLTETRVWLYFCSRYSDKIVVSILLWVLCFHYDGLGWICIPSQRGIFCQSDCTILVVLTGTLTKLWSPL
jgi:hypothetical protein